MTARRLLPFALLGCLTGCAKDTDDWLAELGDGESLTRTLAAIALRDAPVAEHPRVALALVSMLQIEAVETVAKHGEVSLEHLAVASPEVLVDLVGQSESRDYRHLLIAALSAASDRARPPLLAALRGDGAVDRSALAVALGRTGRRAIPLLVAWADDGEPHKLAAVMAGIDAAGSAGQQLIPDTAARLLACLDDADRWPRRVVLDAIADASRDSAIAAWALAVAVEAAPPGSRDAVLAAVVRGVARRLVRERPGDSAASLLGHLGDRAIPHLIDVVLEAEDSRVKRWAAISLAALGTGSVALMLERGVDDRWVILVVNGLREPGWVALREAANSDNEAVRRAAVRFERR